jgi:hypothetical protein
LGWCLLLLLTLGFNSAVWAYAGNAYISQSIWDSVGSTMQVFAGTEVDQNGNGATITLIENTHWKDDGYNVDVKRVISIYASPNNPAWLLFTSGDTYAVVKITLGTNVPSDTDVDSLSWYKKGTPDAPLSLAIEVGYETALATWTLNDAVGGTGYKYNGIDVEVATDAGFADKVIRYFDSASETTTSLGKVLQYAMGELVDGRELSTDEDGMDYYFRVRGKVYGGFESAWASAPFTTQSVGGGVPMTFDIPMVTGYPLCMYMISMPYNLDYANAQSIAEDINTTIGADPDSGQGVTEISRFNPATQGWESASYNTDLHFWVSSPDPVDIVPGEGYILYFKSDITGWTPNTL